MEPSRSLSPGRRTLRMAGLSRSDFQLFTLLKKHFGFDMRQIVILGFRWLYASWHEPRLRAMVIALAQEIVAEDLNEEGPRGTYRPLDAITQDIPS